MQGGNLYTLVKEQGRLEEKQAAKIINRVLKAVEYL